MVNIVIVWLVGSSGQESRALAVYGDGVSGAGVGSSVGSRGKWSAGPVLGACGSCLACIDERVGGTVHGIRAAC